MRNIALMVLLAAMCAAGGCRAKQLRDDQDCFRCMLLDMETNQIMDNLIRAYKGFPIVHVDYGEIAGVVTDDLNGDFRYDYTDAMGAITRAFSLMTGGSNQKQLGVTGNPIRDDPNIYLAYLNYLKVPGGLVETLGPPPEGAAHIVRCCGGTYYWIPVECRGEFFELSMRVIGLRSEPLVVDEFFRNTVKSASVRFPANLPDEKIAKGKSVGLVITLSESMKSDTGKLVFESGSRVFNLDFSPTGGAGIDTFTINASYVYGDEDDIPIGPNALAAQLTGKAVKLYPARFRPAPPTRDRLLEDIRSQLNFIRMNQLRLGLPN